MVTRDLLLLLLALQVAGREPSQELCDQFCSQPRAREIEKCKLCPESEEKSASRPESVRGDIGEDFDNYDYDSDLMKGIDSGMQPEEEEEEECDPSWCENFSCPSDSGCMSMRKYDTLCPCVNKEVLNISTTCTTSRHTLEANLSSLRYLDPEDYSLFITVEEGGTVLKMEELDQSDWESQLTRSFDVAGCRGDERKLCVVLHEGGDEIKRTCQLCEVSGPPHFDPALVRFSKEFSGLTFLTLQWDPAIPECENTSYRVLLNGEKYDQSTKETSQKIGVSEKRLAPGEYTVSVLAENEDGDSESHGGEKYRIRSLSPPDPDTLLLVHWVDQDLHLLTNISWQSDLNSTIGGYYVTLTNPDNSTADGFPKNLTWTTTSLPEVGLSSSHPGARLSIQTFEQSSSPPSSFSEPVEIFRDLDISAPHSLHVTHSNGQKGLGAVLSWTNGVSLNGSPVDTVDITTNIEIWEQGVKVRAEDVGLQQTEHFIGLNGISWNSEVRILHASSNHGDPHPASDTLALFSSVELSPPENITISFSFQEELMATVHWDNQMPELYAEEVKTVVHLHREERDGREKRSVGTESFELDYSQTQTTLTISSLGWGSSISLQAKVGDVTGDQTERVPVFTEELRTGSLSPVEDVQVDVEGSESLVLSWTNPNTALDSGDLVPLVLRLYYPSRDQRELVITETDTGRFHISQTDLQCQDSCQLWSLNYSLGVQGQEEGKVVGLLDTFPLLPPDNISVVCRKEECELSWCLPASQPHIQGMGTILNLRNSSHSSVWEAESLNLTDRCDNVTFPLLLATHLTLQTYIPGFKAGAHSQEEPLLAPSHSPLEDKLWLIIGLSLLLILYILGTVLCLRRVKKCGGGRGKYEVNPGPHSPQRESFLPSAAQEEGLGQARSDTGSRDTEQSSLSDSERALIMNRTGSEITLGYYCEDYDIGDFNEDGSFIGDYKQFKEENSQALQNQLLMMNNKYKEVY